MLELKVLALLFVANGAPIIAQWVLDRRWSWPVDGGRRFADGLPLLGPTKTIRGVALGVLAGVAAAPLVGLPVSVGLVAGFFAMLGDLLSQSGPRLGDTGETWEGRQTRSLRGGTRENADGTPGRDDLFLLLQNRHSCPPWQ